MSHEKLLIKNKPDDLDFGCTEIIDCSPAGGFNIYAFPERYLPSGKLYNDGVTTQINDFKCWEPFETELIIECLRQEQSDKGVVLDIGAHIGYYTLLSAKLGFTTFAFESDQDLGLYINESAKINKLENLITTITGIVTYQQKNLWQFGKTISLDSYGFKKVSLMKVDVEGGEHLVIRGAQSLFREKRVSNAIVEISPVFDFKTPMEKYIEMTLFITDCGYKVFDIGLSPKRQINTDHQHLESLHEYEIKNPSYSTIKSLIENIPQTNFFFRLK